MKEVVEFSSFKARRILNKFVKDNCVIKLLLPFNMTCWNPKERNIKRYLENSDQVVVARLVNNPKGQKIVIVY